MPKLKRARISQRSAQRRAAKRRHVRAAREDPHAALDSFAEFFAFAARPLLSIQLWGADSFYLRGAFQGLASARRMWPDARISVLVAPDLAMHEHGAGALHDLARIGAEIEHMPLCYNPNAYRPLRYAGLDDPHAHTILLFDPHYVWLKAAKEAIVAMLAAWDASGKAFLAVAFTGRSGTPRPYAGGIVGCKPHLRAPGTPLMREALATWDYGGFAKYGVDEHFLAETFLSEPFAEQTFVWPCCMFGLNNRLSGYSPEVQAKMYHAAMTELCTGV